MRNELEDAAADYRLAVCAALIADNVEAAALASYEAAKAADRAAKTALSAAEARLLKVGGG